MLYPKYENYKSSNIPFAGDIPSHWKIIKSKFLFKERIEKGYEQEPLLAATQEHGVILKSLLDYKTVLALKDLHLLKLVKVGDFVISLRSFQGGIEYAYHQGIISPAYTILIPSSTIHKHYYRFLLKSNPFISILSTLTTGIREGQNINVGEFKNLLLPVPPLTEQIAIATYLDRKLSDIDTFIAKKQRLVTLLQEQKAAMINKAVTKGLNKGETRPSGIAWLGDIPAHWEVRKLKYVVSCNDEALSDKTDAKTLIQYVDIGNVDSLGNILEIATYMYKDAPSRARRITRQGDVIISTVRTYLKAIAEIKQNNLIVSTGFAVLRPNLKIISSPFLYLALQADYFIHKVTANSVGVGYPAINASELVKLKIPVPPLSEQIAIVSHIETESARIDKAISLVERELTLVQEYRTALIAEAVTGKIKCPDAM